MFSPTAHNILIFKLPFTNTVISVWVFFDNDVLVWGSNYLNKCEIPLWCLCFSIGKVDIFHVLCGRLCFFFEDRTSVPTHPTHIHLFFSGGGGEVGILLGRLGRPGVYFKLLSSCCCPPTQALRLQACPPFLFLCVRVRARVCVYMGFGYFSLGAAHLFLKQSLTWDRSFTD